MCAEWKSLFDPDKARGPRTAPDVGSEAAGDQAAGAGAQAGTMTVSALIARIKGALADAFPQRVTVVGEISNVNLHSSGHVYFRLKDERTSIDAVMFRSQASRLKFKPTDGLEVVAEGSVDVYDVRGQLQLYVERMTPKGAGALELAFRELCRKLQQEGLFDPAAKKPLPCFPRAVGVITSSTGAAIRDIRRTLLRRWPAAKVFLLPALVQGEAAAEQIAEAVALMDANAERYRIDVLIVARGGGSLEDLWAFNEEAVARAIFAARTPAISGVGHEVDVTIADMVADVRAATPTAAAELAVPDGQEIGRHVAVLAGRLARTVKGDLDRAGVALDAVLRSVVFRDPTSRLRTEVQRVDELSHRLRIGLGERLSGLRRRLEPTAGRLAALHPARLSERAKARLEGLMARLRWVFGRRCKKAGDELTAMYGRLLAAHPRHRLRLAREQVAAAARELEALSYRGVLKRGYSVTRMASRGILRSVQEVSEGDSIETELVDGKFHSSVGGDGRKSADGRPDREGGSLKGDFTASRTRRKPPGRGQPTLFD